MSQDNLAWRVYILLLSLFDWVQFSEFYSHTNRSTSNIIHFLKFTIFYSRLVIKISRHIYAACLYHLAPVWLKELEEREGKGCDFKTKMVFVLSFKKDEKGMVRRIIRGETREGEGF